MEVTAGIVMLVAMAGAVLSKYLTTLRTFRLREHILQAEADVRNIRGKLKAMENERAIAERNAKTMERQRNVLEKQITNLKQELDSLNK